MDAVMLFKMQLQYFPGGAVNKNLPANAGNMGSVPGLGGFQCCRAAKPVCHNYWACAPHLGPRAHEPRAHAPQEKPMHSKIDKNLKKKNQLH